MWRSAGWTWPLQAGPPAAQPPEWPWQLHGPETEDGANSGRRDVTTGRETQVAIWVHVAANYTSISSEELRFRLDSASRMATVSWVFSCRRELQERQWEKIPKTKCQPDKAALLTWHWVCTHLSSLAMSLCWESSSISGRLVMMSLWTSTGATDTSSMSLVANSCSEEQDTGEDQWGEISGTATNTHGITMSTLGSTTLSSHLNWLMMMRGMLRPPSPALWKSAKC